MAIAEITAAASLIKIVGDASNSLKKLITVTEDPDVKDALRDLRDQIGDLRDKGHELQEEIHTLRQENSSLKEQLEDKTHLQWDGEKYFTEKDGEKIYYCQPCKDDKNKKIKGADT